MTKRLIHFMSVTAVLTVIALACFSATSFAAGAVAPDDGSIIDLLKPVYDAFAGGHYAYAAALGIVALVGATKYYLGDKIKALHTDAGQAVLALVGAAATAMATGLATPGADVTLALLESSLAVGVAAAGGYTVIKHLLIVPLLRPLEAKLPTWAQPLTRVVTWLFDEPDTTPATSAPAPIAPPVVVIPGPPQGAVPSLPPTTTPPTQTPSK